MKRRRRIEARLRELRIIAGIMFLGVLTYQLISLSPLVKALMGSATATVTTVKTLVDTVSSDYYDPKNPEQGFYWEIDDALQNSAIASRTTTEVLGHADKDLLKVGTLLGSLNATVQELNIDIANLTDDAHNTLVPLKSTMGNIEVLTAELDAEMKDEGPLDSTVKEAYRSLQDLNKLLENEDIKRTLSNTADASKSFAGMAETGNDILLPLRKKANRVATILKFIASRFTIPL